MKIFANIENDGYWIPGNTYYIDIWMLGDYTDSFDLAKCPVTGVRTDGKKTVLMRADSEIVTVAGWAWGATGEYTEEAPPVYDFTTNGQTLADYYGGLTLDSSEVLFEGNSYRLERFYFDVDAATPPATIYLKMCSGQDVTCLEA